MFRRLSALPAVALAVAAAWPAAAADMAYGAPMAYAQPMNAFSWSGFYVGANVGYGWGTSNFEDPTGLLGGFQAGYNLQISGPFVVGAEVDFDFAAISAGPISLDELGTVRIRGGYTFDRILLYGTLGYAWGQGSLEVLGMSSSANHSGWTVGAGVEVALGVNWSTKLEYLYVDLGSTAFQTVFGPRSVGFDGGVLRGGVNYRF